MARTLRTPLGSLDQLNLEDHDLCAELLALDKHQLVESICDQYVAAMVEASGWNLGPLPVETATVLLPQAARTNRPTGCSSERAEGPWASVGF